MARYPDPSLRAGVRPGSSIYYSLRFLEPERRKAASALYGLIGALEQATAGVGEESVARTKLAWWGEELQRLYAGAPRHPATRTLQPWLSRHTLPEEYFLEILSAAEMDLEQTRYPRFRDLRLYCHHRGANAALLASEVFGYQDAHTPRFAQAVGVAQCLGRLLRGVREDSARGLVHVPEEDLRRFGVTAGDLLQPQAGERVRALLKFQLDRVREQYRHALTLLPDSDRVSQHPLLVQVRLDLALLDEIERDGLRLLEHRIDLPALRKLWIAWRTFQGARRQAKRSARAAEPEKRRH